LEIPPKLVYFKTRPEVSAVCPINHRARTICALFMLKTSKQVGLWLRKTGFGHYEAEAEEVPINGLVLAALTKSKLQQYLSMPAEEAAKLKCAVDREMLGVGPEKRRMWMKWCTEPGPIARYESFKGHWDNAIFFGLKSLDGPRPSNRWLAQAARRVLSRADEWIPGWIADKYKIKKPAKVIEHMIAKSVDLVNLYNHTTGLVKAMADPEFLRPLTIARRYLYLSNRVSHWQTKWDDCQAVYNRFMEPTLWDESATRINRKTTNANKTNA